MRLAHWQTALKMAVTNEGTLVRVARHASVSSLFTPTNRTGTKIKITQKTRRYRKSTTSTLKIKKNITIVEKKN